TPTGGHHERSKSTDPRASEASGANESIHGGLDDILAEVLVASSRHGWLGGRGTRGGGRLSLARLLAGVLARVVARGAGIPAAVDSLAQLLADLEERQALGRDVDDVAGPWVAAFVGLVLPNREAAEAANLDPVTGDQRRGHRVEDGVDDHLRPA